MTEASVILMPLPCLPRIVHKIDFRVLPLPGTVLMHGPREQA